MASALQRIKLKSRDFIEMEQALSAFDHRYEQVSPGAFRGALHLVGDDTLGVFRNRWERAIHYNGIPPEGAAAFAVTLNQHGHGRWVGNEVFSDTLMVGPKGVEADYFSGPLWDSLVITIRETELLERIARFTEGDPQAPLRRPCAPRLEAEGATRIARLGLSYLQEADRHLAGIDPLPDDVSLQVVRDALLDEIGFAVVGVDSIQSARPALDRQRALVASAIDYADRRDSVTIRYSEMCDDLGVSPRTMRYAFRSVTGLPPTSALRARRLNAVYRALKTTEPATHLVKQVALEHGFQHMGRFSRDYSALFGESPSRTLARLR